MENDKKGCQWGGNSGKSHFQGNQCAGKNILTIHLLKNEIKIS